MDSIKKVCSTNFDMILDILFEKLAALRNKKILFVVIAAVFVAETLWTYQTLTKPTIIPFPRPATAKDVSPKAVLTLSSSTSVVKVGDQVTVLISVISNRPIDGMDLVINYDPKILSIVPTTTGTVNVSKLYDYPLNKADVSIGRITVSGITTAAIVVTPNGPFGTITFKAKAAGKTEIKFDFTPGQMTDSNVIEIGTLKDILESVQNLSLEVR